MKKIIEFENLLGCNIDYLEKKNNFPLEKKYHSNGETYSIFINENEYVFMDDELYSIELREDFGYPTEIDNMALILENNNIEWEIFQKYSYGKNIVIKANQYIFFEYSFDDNKFILDVIRISNNE